MKKFIFYMLSACILCSHLSGQPSSAPKPSTESDLKKKLREPIPDRTDKASKKIIANYLKVKGGERKLRNLDSIYVEGHMREGIREYKVLFWEAPKDKIRLEEISKKLGREERIIYGFDGNQSWIYDLTKKRPLPAERSKSNVRRLFRKNTFYGPFINSDAQGLIFKYEGKVVSKGRFNYLVKMFHPTGLTEYFYFDAKNFMISRHGWEEILQGSIVTKDEYFTKYQKVDGIWVPEIVEFAIAEQVYGKFTVKKYEIDPDLDHHIFSMPKFKERWLRQK